MTPYVLTGETFIVDDPDADLWADTTTLFREPRKEDSADSSLVAVGIIRVHLLDFLKQVITIRVSGGSAKENAWGVARFGRFFFGVYDVSASGKNRRELEQEVGNGPEENVPAARIVANCPPQPKVIVELMEGKSPI